MSAFAFMHERRPIIAATGGMIVHHFPPSLTFLLARLRRARWGGFSGRRKNLHASRLLDGKKALGRLLHEDP